MILVDTNILIDALKGDQSTIDELASIGSESVILSSVVIAELYQGALNKQELFQIDGLVKSFSRIELDETISALAIDLLFDYSLSHNLKFPDALIAATAILTNFELFTRNIKDFRYIPNVRLR